MQSIVGCQTTTRRTQMSNAIETIFHRFPSVDNLASIWMVFLVVHALTHIGSIPPCGALGLETVEKTLLAIETVKRPFLTLTF